MVKVIVQKLPNGEPSVIDVPLPEGEGDYVITTLGGAATRVRAGAVEMPPYFGSPPSIVGSSAPGGELLVNVGVIGGVPLPEVEVRWLAAGRPIEGETGLSHRVQADAAPEAIEAEVTIRNRLGVARRRVGAGRVEVAPSFAGRPRIDGDPRPGRTVRAAMPAPKGTQPVAVGHEWRLDGGDPIGTDAALVIPEDAAWRELSLRVTLTNAHGSVADTAASVLVRGVATASVSIGPEAARPGTELTITTFRAQGFDPAQLVYRWHRDETPIEGATGQSYVVAEADRLALVTLRLSHPDLDGDVISNAVEIATNTVTHDGEAVTDDGAAVTQEA